MKAIAEMRETATGPQLRVCGVLVNWEIGADHNNNVRDQASEINAAHAKWCADKISAQDLVKRLATERTA